MYLRTLISKICLTFFKIYIKECCNEKFLLPYFHGKNELTMIDFMPIKQNRIDFTKKIFNS